MSHLIKIQLIIICLFINYYTFSQQKNITVIDSLKKEINNLNISNNQIRANNEQLKNDIDYFKKETFDNIIRQYQLTNDRINTHITLLGAIATIFGVIIALIGIWITYQSYLTQNKSKEALKTIEEAKEYADNKKKELDALFSKKQSDFSKDYKKMLELIKDSTLNDINNVIKNVKDVSEKKAEEIKSISVENILNDINTTVKKVKDISEQKTEEIKSISIQQEKSEEAKLLNERIEFLENLGLTDDPKVLLSKAKILHQEGKFNEAIAVLEKVILKDKTNGEAYWYLAHSLSNIQKIELAIENYKKSIELNYFLSGSYNNLGVIFENLQQNEESLKMYDEAIKIDPHGSLYIRNKGKLLLKLGRNSEGIENLKKVLEINPADKEIYNLLIQNYKKENKQAEVISIFDTAIKNLPSDEKKLNFDKGVYLREINLYDDAEIIFQNLLKQGVSIIKCKGNIALIKTAQGKLTEVDEILESLASNFPDDELTYSIITHVLIKQSAEKVAEFIRKHLTNIKSKTIFQNAARIIANEQRLELASEFYREAINLLRPNLEKHIENEILEYFEGLMILKQFNEAEIFFNENKKYIKNDQYILISIFLSHCLSRFKGEIDDNKFLEEISNIIPIKVKWLFEDINNYLRPVISPQSYDKMIEIQTLFKK